MRILQKPYLNNGTVMGMNEMIIAVIELTIDDIDALLSAISGSERYHSQDYEYHNPFDADISKLESDLKLLKNQIDVIR